MKVKLLKNTPGLGAEFEVLFPAYLALKFFENDEIKDFQLRSNVKGFEKFDDVLIDLEMENGDQHHFAIQLKHRVRKDGKLKPENFHTGANFNLEKYCEAYHRLASDKYKCAIFTNASFDSHKIKEVKKFTMGLSEDDFVNNLLNSGIGNENVYKFEINKETDNKEKFEKFFQHFFLFVAQNNTKELEKEIKFIFRIVYSVEDLKVSTEYINLFRKWHKRQFTNDTLDRKALSMHLLDLLLGNFMLKPTNGTIKRDEKLSLLEECVRRFDVTVIEDSELKLINELAKCEQENFLPSYMKELLNTYVKHYNIVGNDLFDQCIFRLAQEYKLIDKWQKELETHDKMKVFNYLLEKPLIINFNEDSKDKIFKVLKMDFKGDVNIKFVFLGKGIYSYQEQFGNLKNFNTLEDLRTHNNSLYQQIINEVDISLRGTEKVKLEKIVTSHPELARTIQVKHLFQENMTIGETLEELPEFYIYRTVSVFLLNEEKVLEEFIKKNKLLVIVCGNEIYQYIKEIALRESLEIINLDQFIEQITTIKEETTEQKYLVVTKEVYIKQQFNKICTTIDNDVCLFKINKRRQFILIKSKNNGINEKFMEETETLFNFCEGINVLCAEPGMGKTSSMKNFRNECPSDQWPVFLELRHFNSLFKEDNLQSGEILERLLHKDNEDTMTKNMRNIFIEKRKILLFLDGLDELDHKSIDNVLLFVKNLEEDKFNVWLSSRNNLKDEIETKLNLFSIDFNQVNPEQQRDYINKRLRPHNYSEDQTNKIVNNIFDSINIQNNSNILGIPLQLFMVTQTLIDDKNKYSKISEKQFILTKLYSNYFKGKIKHTLQKNGKFNESIFRRHDKLIMEQYEISGLRCCLSDEDFNNLNMSENKLEKDKKFINDIKMSCDSYGIIKSINEDKTVTFVHHTHAEYFAAIYFSQNFDKVRILGESFLKQKYDNLRLLFDIKLAENTPLHLSVIYDNLNQFNEYIENYDNRNMRDKGGRTSLHLLCIHGTRYSALECKKEEKDICYVVPPNIKEEKKSFKTMTDKLVEIYPSMTEDDIFKWNEFQYATKCWCLYPLQTILKEEKKSNKFSRYRKTRWFLKRNSFSKDVETFLINNDKGAVAYYAAKFGYQNLMKVLFLGSDFSINKMKYDQNLYTLLHTACIEGHEEVAQWLIKKKSKIDAVDLYGDTPLHYACLKGNKEIVTLLIQSKANVNAANEYSYTPLNYADQKGHQEIVQLLIEHNARNDNNNVLHDACKKGHHKIVQFLIKNNADINNIDNNGDTPLRCAFKYKHNEIAKLLIHSNADVNSTDKHGDTPLHWACKSGDYEVAKLLILNNADVNGTDKHGDTPLLWACKNRVCEVAKLLIQKNADVDSTDKYGNTPLHWACKKGEKEIAVELIKYNANVNSTDKYGNTPLYYARQNKHNEIVSLMLTQNASVNGVK